MKKLPSKLKNNFEINLDDTIKEIKDAFSNKLLKDYNDVKYNNYKLLYSSKEMQKEVFIKGISGSLDVP
jgi:hypothetical protein